MSEVKRFMPVINNKPYKPYAYCEENEDGIYVRLSDYAELEAQRDALAAESAALKSAITYVCDTDNLPDYQCDGMGCGIEDRGIVDRYEAARYGWDEAMDRIYSEVIPCAADIETPATDAYLNSVRAEAVKTFCQLIAQHGKVEPHHFNADFADLYAKINKEVYESILDNPAVYDMETLVDWLEQTANDSRAYADMSIESAAQLRAGEPS